jgi:non-specific serine/threonine protein kinase
VAGIEQADEALAADRLETAEACQAELDQLVAQLAWAFGLGGRDRRAASAVERARPNVTLTLRTASRAAGGGAARGGRVLDWRVGKGLYAHAPRTARRDPLDRFVPTVCRRRV